MGLDEVHHYGIGQVSGGGGGVGGGGGGLGMETNVVSGKKSRLVGGRGRGGVGWNGEEI